VNLSELRTALQERREDYSQSDAKLNRRINQAYLSICSRRRWGWLRRRHTQTTYASFFHANTGADSNTPSASAVYVVGTENGKRTIAISQHANTPVTTMGKLVRIDNDFYRVMNINATGTKWTLDRQLRCAQTIASGATANHSIKILFTEVALPVGSLSVVESTLFKGGSTTYGTPLSMGAISPESMSHLDLDVEGRPTRFATVRKEPIPAPRITPTLAASAGSTLPLGKYTYWYTYVDKQTGAESAKGPSSSVTLEVSNVQHITVGTPSPDQARKDFNLRLYRSTVDGTAAYLLEDPASTSISGFVDSITDDYLSIPGPNSSSTLFMQLYPVPDSEYEIQSLIQIEPSPMADDNDFPIFDSQFHGVILDGAEALMLEAADEQGRANQARQRYEMGIARMIQLDRLNMQQSVVFSGKRQVRGSATWWYGALKT